MTIAIRILATDTTETLASDTPAIGIARFSRMYRDAHGQSAEVPAEVHTDPMWAGPDAAVLHEELVDDLADAAGTLEAIGAEGYVLLVGQGDDCDVWARFEVAD